MIGDGCVLKFPRRSVDGKHLMRFQSENAVLKFLRLSVDGDIQNSLRAGFLLGRSGSHFRKISQLIDMKTNNT